MRRLIVIPAIALLAIEVGCTKSEFTRANFTIMTHGYVGRDKVTGVPTGRVKLFKVQFDGTKEYKPLNRGRRIETQEYLLLQFLRNNLHTYGILLGPNPGSTTETAVAEIVNADVAFAVSVPVVQIACGWVYLTGTQPQVQTEWVNAGASGSKIVMHITTDELGRNVHRYYFLAGATGYVQSRYVSANRQDLLAADVNKYVDAYSDYSLSEPISVVAGSPAQEFLNSIQAYIDASEVEAMY